MIKYIFYLLRLAMKYYSINFIKAEGGWLHRCLLLFQAKYTTKKNIVDFDETVQ